VNCTSGGLIWIEVLLGLLAFSNLLYGLGEFGRNGRYA
jgi:hypothetical protein